MVFFCLSFFSSGFSFFFFFCLSFEMRAVTTVSFVRQVARGRVRNGFGLPSNGYGPAAGEIFPD